MPTAENNEKLRREMLKRLREQGVVDKEGKEKGLEEEGLLDVLRPVKKYAKEKAKEIGIPSIVTETVDMLTPEGVDLPIGKIAGAIKALIAKGAPVALSALPMLRMPKILKKNIPDSSKVKVESTFLDKEGRRQGNKESISKKVTDKLTKNQLTELKQELGYSKPLAETHSSLQQLNNRLQMNLGKLKGYKVTSTNNKPSKAFSTSEQSYSPRRGTSYPRDTVEGKLERSKDTASTVTHEAIHKTLDDAGMALANPISEKLGKKISRHQITRALEEEANSGLLNSTSWSPFRNFLTKGLGYKSGHLEMETLPWANSLLTNPRYREMYKNYLKDSAKDNPEIDVDKVFNETINGLKSSYKNVIKKMNNLTEDQVVDIVKVRVLGDVQQPGAAAATKVKK